MNTTQRQPNRESARQRPLPWCTLVTLASLLSSASIVLACPPAAEAMCALATTVSPSGPTWERSHDHL
jgi:hypothetical protein